jgi:nucleotide-binding universal stress UspA family protein
MNWGHVLAAVDETPAGLHALELAEGLCRSANLKLSVVTVLPVESEIVPASLASYQPIVAHGIPGIEIVRVAEQVEADLLVLGRTMHQSGGISRLGPTADQVVRRSRIPCLFVPAGQEKFAHHLVALDGTERGFAVFEAAREFLGLTGGDVEVVTVEPVDSSSGNGANEVPRARTLRVAGKLDRVSRENRRRYPLQVLRGDPLPLLRGEIRHPATDLFVVGARRGGPAGPPEPSSGVGRGLLYSAICAVLTVPL